MNTLLITTIPIILIIILLLLLVFNKEVFKTYNILEYLPKKIKQCNGDKGPRGERGVAGNNA